MSSPEILSKEIAAKKYPCLLDPSFFQEYSLIFELIFPEGRVVTNYGDEEDLYLTGCFHLGKMEYFNYSKLKSLSIYAELNLVKALEAKGNNYKEKMENALNSIKGTDKEGFIIFALSELDLYIESGFNITIIGSSFGGHSSLHLAKYILDNRISAIFIADVESKVKLKSIDCMLSDIDVR